MFQRGDLVMYHGPNWPQLHGKIGVIEYQHSDSNVGFSYFLTTFPNNGGDNRRPQYPLSGENLTKVELE